MVFHVRWVLSRFQEFVSRWRALVHERFLVLYSSCVSPWLPIRTAGANLKFSRTYRWSPSDLRVRDARRRKSNPCVRNVGFHQVISLPAGRGQVLGSYMSPLSAWPEQYAQQHAQMHAWRFAVGSPTFALAACTWVFHAWWASPRTKPSEVDDDHVLSIRPAGPPGVNRHGLVAHRSVGGRPEVVSYRVFKHSP